MSPRNRWPGATWDETAASDRRRATTMGRSRERSSDRSGSPEVAQTLGLGQVPDHEGKGFGHPALALSQGFHGLVMAGVGGQVKAAEAFDGHNSCRFSASRAAAGMASRSRRRPALLQPDPGAADGAGGGLGMKAPVLGIFIFCPALGAKVKAAMVVWGRS